MSTSALICETLEVTSIDRISVEISRAPNDVMGFFGSAEKEIRFVAK